MREGDIPASPGESLVEASTSVLAPMHEGSTIVGGLVDVLALSLQELAASSPKSKEEEDIPTIVLADTQQKLDECLRLYSNGLPTLARSLVHFLRLGGLLLGLLDQPDLPPSGRYYAKTLSAHLSSFLAQQQALFAEHVALDAHFSQVSYFKEKATDVATPLINFNKWDDVLKDQELALRQRIAYLKEELTEAEKALAYKSEECASL